MKRLLAASAVLVVVAVGSAAAVGPGSGIRGRVVAAPTCPVEREPPDPQCAPRGFAARVRIYRTSDHHTVARRTTGAGGRFTARLPVGRYGVSARPLAGGSLPSCPPRIQATVHRGRYTRVAVDCDSGIR